MEFFYYYRLYSPLLIAAENCNFQVFSFLCSLDGIDVNCPNYANMTPLHCCAKRSIFDYVKILVNHKKIILNPKDIDGILIQHVFIEHHLKCAEDTFKMK